jgi:hypothetical protein
LVTIDDRDFTPWEARSAGVTWRIAFVANDLHEQVVEVREPDPRA